MGRGIKEGDGIRGMESGKERGRRGNGTKEAEGRREEEKCRARRGDEIRRKLHAPEGDSTRNEGCKKQRILETKRKKGGGEKEGEQMCRGRKR